MGLEMYRRRINTVNVCAICEVEYARNRTSNATLLVMIVIR